MASSSSPSAHNSFDIINGRWIIPMSITGDAEFRLLWCAYEGRDRARFLREESSARNNTNLDIFLKLVTNNIRSTNPEATYSQAIVYYGLCSAIREQDFDFLKRIIDFLVEYNIL
jgi:hypothetical protein